MGSSLHSRQAVLHVGKYNTVDNAASEQRPGQLRWGHLWQAQHGCQPAAGACAWGKRGTADSIGYCAPFLSQQAWQLTNGKAQLEP